jgi:glycerophosphoryl diester phosphodiesterase
VALSGVVENTLPALQRAHHRGFKTFSIPVRLSRDEKPILCADSELSRLADRPQAVDELTLAELTGLEVGEGGRLAPLEEVFSTLGKDVRYVVELPGRGIWSSGVSQVLASIERFGLSQQVQISSSSPLVLMRARAEAPQVARELWIPGDKRPWLIAEPFLPLWLRLIQPAALRLSPGELTGQRVKDLHAAGMEVNVGAVDDEQRFQEVARLGVDAVYSFQTSFQSVPPEVPAPLGDAGETPALAPPGSELGIEPATANPASANPDGSSAAAPAASPLP